MSHIWLIESLADLRAYAARNNLPALAEHLDTAIQLAHLELANKAANDTHAPKREGAPAPDDQGPEGQKRKDHGPENHWSDDDRPETEGPEEPDPEDPGPTKPDPKNRSP